MPKPEKPMPESVLPSLRNKKSIETTRGNTIDYDGIDISWQHVGDEGYGKEFEELFGDQVINFCVARMKENNGKLKIVSFGAGEFEGMLQLRDILISRGKQQGLKPEIKILDYALSSLRGVAGIKAAGEKELLENGTIVIKSGKLELRQINDAEGADIMISRRGPFHKVDMRLLPELLKKVAKRLTPGGGAFLEVAFITPEDAKIISDKLGEQFEVKGARTIYEGFKTRGHYVKIKRLK